MEQQETTAAHIIALECAALEGWNRGNPSAYLDLYAPEITYFDPFQEKRFDGIETMQVFYESLRGQISVEKYEMIDPTVQLHDMTAVLTYNLNSWAGGDLFRWNCTEVFRQQPDGSWKIIHNHWSFIKPLG
ncbi:MAG: nuclear transport factor 2 family protein [Rikenellaceae bacterium]|jgi:ketosteroid isomerase-like protein|nr:nuclear transport factor 2 family protein [Rikenellaceae bacterium]